MYQTLGVDFEGVEMLADMTYGVDDRQVVVDKIRVRIGTQRVNHILCEDAQNEVEAQVKAYLEREQDPREVIIGKHIDEVRPRR
jgi:hypothetical protein